MASLYILQDCPLQLTPAIFSHEGLVLECHCIKCLLWDLLSFPELLLFLYRPLSRFTLEHKEKFENVSMVFFIFCLMQTKFLCIWTLKIKVFVTYLSNVYMFMTDNSLIEKGLLICTCNILSWSTPLHQPGTTHSVFSKEEGSLKS